MSSGTLSNWRRRAVLFSIGHRLSVLLQLKQNGADSTCRIQERSWMSVFPAVFCRFKSFFAHVFSVLFLLQLILLCEN